MYGAVCWGESLSEPRSYHPRIRSGAVEPRHEAEIHVQLFVTAEEGGSAIVRNELEFLKSGEHNGILHSSSFPDSHELGGLPMQVQRLNVVAATKKLTKPTPASGDSARTQAS